MRRHGKHRRVALVRTDGLGGIVKRACFFIGRNSTENSAEVAYLCGDENYANVGYRQTQPYLS